MIKTFRTARLETFASFKFIFLLSTTLIIVVLLFYIIYKNGFDEIYPAAVQ